MIGKSYREECFTISEKDGTLYIDGTVESFNYDTMKAFIDSVSREIVKDELVLDFTKARYVNSTGIRIFAVFITSLTKKLRIRIDPSLDWQRTSIGMLATLKPEYITLESVAEPKSYWIDVSKT